MVVRSHWPMWSIPAVIGGAAVGALLATAAHARNDALGAALITLLPFIIAALTGVAKNTTV